MKSRELAPNELYELVELFAPGEPNAPPAGCGFRESAVSQASEGTQKRSGQFSRPGVGSLTRTQSETVAEQLPFSSRCHAAQRFVARLALHIGRNVFVAKEALTARIHEKREISHIFFDAPDDAAVEPVEAWVAFGKRVTLDAHADGDRLIRHALEGKTTIGIECDLSVVPCLVASEEKPCVGRDRFAVAQRDAACQAAPGAQRKITEFDERTINASLDSLYWQGTVVSERFHFSEQVIFIFRRDVEQHEIAVRIGNGFEVVQAYATCAFSGNKADQDVLERAALAEDLPRNRHAFLHSHKMVLARFKCDPTLGDATAFDGSVDGFHSILTTKPEPAVVIRHGERIDKIIGSPPLGALPALYAFGTDDRSDKCIALGVEHHARDV